MGAFFEMIGNFWFDVYSVLDSHTFSIWNINVSVFDLIFAFLVAGLVVSIMWKGAKT